MYAHTQMNFCAFHCRERRCVLDIVASISWRVYKRLRFAYEGSGFQLIFACNLPNCSFPSILTIRRELNIADIRYRWQLQVFPSCFIMLFQELSVQRTVHLAGSKLDLLQYHFRWGCFYDRVRCFAICSSIAAASAVKKYNRSVCQIFVTALFWAWFNV